MSCDFQTNRGVEVALMLQTDVTSARSSWGIWRVFDGARAPPSDHPLVRTAGPHQREQRAAAAAGFFKGTYYVAFFSILIRFKFRTSDDWKKINSDNVLISFSSWSQRCGGEAIDHKTESAFCVCCFCLFSSVYFNVTTNLAR